MHPKMRAWVLVTCLAMGATAQAHTDEYLDTLAAPHGGQLRMAGAYHLELVLAADGATVYLTDHGGTEVVTKGFEGLLVVVSPRGKKALRLAPAGGNVLRASGALPAAPGVKAVVSVHPPGQPAQQARFTPRLPGTPPAAAR